MLNENVVITICGKNYSLRTDNRELLIAAANSVDGKISEYCGENSDISKEDAAVFSALECFNEIEELKAGVSKISAELTRLKAQETEAKKALDENGALKAENEQLLKIKTEFEKLTKRFSELEGKNEQLCETLNDANKQAAEAAALKKQLDEAKKNADLLEKKNAQLSAAAKDNSDSLEKQKKLVSEKEKRIAELQKENEKAVSVSAENKRLLEKLDKAQNFEEAFHREKKRADAVEIERNTLKAANDTLNRSMSDFKSRAENAEKKAKSLTEETAAKDKRIKELSENNEAEKKLAEQLSASKKEYEELAAEYDKLDKANSALKKDLDEDRKSVV